MLLRADHRAEMPVSSLDPLHLGRGYDHDLNVKNSGRDNDTSLSTLFLRKALTSMIVSTSTNPVQLDYSQHLTMLELS